MTMNPYERVLVDSSIVNEKGKTRGNFHERKSMDNSKDKFKGSKLTVYVRDISHC